MPIIGTGDIASVLTDRPDITFFASGVSNSRCTDVGEYEREIKLLLAQDKNRHLVYFSSLSIYYGDSMYVNHKKCVENIIRNNFQSFTIIRLGNIMWGDNPNTFINYLMSHPQAEVKEVFRHIITLDDFKYWMALIPVGIKNEMNLTGDRWFVPDLVKKIRP